MPKIAREYISDNVKSQNFPGGHAPDHPMTCVLHPQIGPPQDKKPSYGTECVRVCVSVCVVCVCVCVCVRMTVSACVSASRS